MLSPPIQSDASTDERFDGCSMFLFLPLMMLFCLVQLKLPLAESESQKCVVAGDSLRGADKAGV